MQGFQVNYLHFCCYCDEFQYFKLNKITTTIGFQNTLNGRDHTRTVINVFNKMKITSA